MNKEELQTVLMQMPETVTIEDRFVWYSKPLKQMPWWKMTDSSNILERFPVEACDNSKLALEYDNAYCMNHGIPPSVEDYQRLFDICEIIPVEGDGGILLNKDGVHFYIAEGVYWTNHADFRGETLYPSPFILEVNNGKHAFVNKKKRLQNSTSCLSLRIEKT